MPLIKEQGLLLSHASCIRKTPIDYWLSFIHIPSLCKYIPRRCQILSPIHLFLPNNMNPNTVNNNPYLHAPTLEEPCKPSLEESGEALSIHMHRLPPGGPALHSCPPVIEVVSINKSRWLWRSALAFLAIVGRFDLCLETCSRPVSTGIISIIWLLFCLAGQN